MSQELKPNPFRKFRVNQKVISYNNPSVKGVVKQVAARYWVETEDGKLQGFWPYELIPDLGHK